MNSTKEPVKIRTKKLEGGVESIYLDVYVDGKRRKEYLKLYLKPETTKEAKRLNKETLAIANEIKAQKMVELQQGKYRFKRKKETDIDLMKYMGEVYREYKQYARPRTARGYKNVILRLNDFLGEKKIKLKDIDKPFIKKFVKYLTNYTTKNGEVYSESTVKTYYGLFVRSLNRAVEEELLEANPCDRLKNSEKPKKPESTRQFLTYEEVKKLIDTPCSHLIVKQMFLFACFTGLRVGDILSLTKKNIVEVEKGVYQLEIVQQKTGRPLVVPLSENAMAWIPEDRDNKDGRLFVYYMTTNEYYVLSQWVKAAGIKKHVTFHVARHTYATLLLYFGADVYTVSKLLGHTNVQVTQVYAKVMDENKRKAVNLIPNI